MKYFVIRPGEDGVRVYTYTKEELEAEIAKEIEEVYDITEDPYNYLQNALPEFPRCEPKEETDPNYWKGPLIIKGSVVQLKPKKVVKEWEIIE